MVCACFHYADLTEFVGEEWQNVSQEAKDLISKMITKPDKRLKASEVLENPWLKMKSDKKSTSSMNITQLRSFMHNSKLKKAVLTFMASQLSESDILELRKIFMSLDTNGDGTLTIEELTEGSLKYDTSFLTPFVNIIGLKKLPDFDPKEVKALMASIDTDKNGKIEYTGM